MTWKIGTRFLNILSRILPSREVRGKGSDVAPHRRVEVTVERESVSILMRGPTAGGAERTVDHTAGIEVTGEEPLPLSPPLPAHPAQESKVDRSRQGRADANGPNQPKRK